VTIIKTKLAFIPIMKDMYWNFYFKLRRLCKKIKQKEKEKWDL